MNQCFFPEGLLLEHPENREALSSLSGMERAMQNGQVLEYPITRCDGMLRLHVEFPFAHGIIPPEEALFCRTGEERKDIAILSRVGKPTSFCIRSIDYREGRAIAHLSRRMAQEKCCEEYLSHRRPGDLLIGCVTHMEPFGAFLDLGCGVTALLSVDAISVSRISHPRDRLSVGNVISVVVRSIDPVSGRIYASLRELLGTWEENAAQFHAGETVTGIIRSVEPYGVFIELTPNLAGLAEVREDALDTYRQKIGHRASVYIKSILPERMKIKLVLIDSFPNTHPTGHPKLFINVSEVTHMDRWLYSPPGARRVVETVFEKRCNETT